MRRGSTSSSGSGSSPLWIKGATSGLKSALQSVTKKDQKQQAEAESLGVYPTAFRENRNKIVTIQNELKQCHKVLNSWVASIEAMRRTAGLMSTDAMPEALGAVGHAMDENGCSLRVLDTFQKTIRLVKEKAVLITRLLRDLAELDRRLLTREKLRRKVDVGARKLMQRGKSFSTEEVPHAHELDVARENFDTLYRAICDFFDFIMIEARRGFAYREYVFVRQYCDCAFKLKDCLASPSSCSPEEQNVTLGDATAGMQAYIKDFWKRLEDFKAQRQRQREIEQRHASLSFESDLRAFVGRANTDNAPQVRAPLNFPSSSSSFTGSKTDNAPPVDVNMSFPRATLVTGPQSMNRSHEYASALSPASTVSAPTLSTIEEPRPSAPPPVPLRSTYSSPSSPIYDDYAEQQQQQWSSRDHETQEVYASTSSSTPVSRSASGSICSHRSGETTFSTTSSQMPIAQSVHSSPHAEERKHHDEDDDDDEEGCPDNISLPPMHVVNEEGCDGKGNGNSYTQIQNSQNHRMEQVKEDDDLEEPVTSSPHGESLTENDEPASQAEQQPPLPPRSQNVYKAPQAQQQLDMNNSSTTAEPSAESSLKGEEQRDEVPALRSRPRPRKTISAWNEKGNGWMGGVTMKLGFPINEKDGWREYISRTTGESFWICLEDGRQQDTNPWEE
mmetsp:Transcript_8971/g.17678  ORF Transcript_8971/g.17678 Transcript_8971/m.17678 type:complete len:673 (+) Transcript_8971:741-2759(+)|eukprot:CAMPEP_0171494548 /NCGR_PEP_ID=MMETSP0958-20121227/5621_1 /TAXON_ID=87120 /ORGANISM="Aurantiochytrium limacinum, Strain ATCCMYA-1381" /LENGTH=672 /DNA_ID=CAMNT_0012028379 /DNA_START=654 /DNA_END=2672 /DNA_ORIENTATION=-